MCILSGVHFNSECVCVCDPAGLRNELYIRSCLTVLIAEWEYYIVMVSTLS